MGGARVLSCNENELSVAENEAISSLNAINAVVVAIRETLGGGVGVGICVGVTATGGADVVGAALRAYNKPKTTIPTNRIAPTTI